MKTFKQLFEETLDEKIEIAYINLKNNKRMRKTFKTQVAFTKWMDKNEGDVHNLQVSADSTFDESALERYKASKAKGDKSSFECMECGKKFKKKIGKGEVKCPSCKSTDVEVD